MSGLVNTADTISPEEAIMESFVNKVKSETPKIDVSLKNLMSVLLGKAQQDLIGRVDVISAQYLMDYTKLFLNVLQSELMLPVLDFAAQFSQSSSQTADQRLDEICQYKAFLAYREHASQNNQKISKLFGRSFFTSTKIWDRIKASFLARLTSGEKKMLTVGEGTIFIELYEKSIFQADNKDSFADLIWATDFTAALRQRQVDRAAAAAKRADEALADAIREQLSQQTGEMKLSSVAEENEQEAQDEGR
jgi:hypothetical protein